jgi:hypothetical protein
LLTLSARFPWGRRIKVNTGWIHGRSQGEGSGGLNPPRKVKINIHKIKTKDRRAAYISHSFPFLR